MLQHVFLSYIWGEREQQQQRAVVCASNSTRRRVCVRALLVSEFSLRSSVLQPLWRALYDKHQRSRTAVVAHTPTIIIFIGGIVEFNFSARAAIRPQRQLYLISTHQCCKTQRPTRDSGSFSLNCLQQSGFSLWRTQVHRWAPNTSRNQGRLPAG